MGPLYFLGFSPFIYIAPVCLLDAKHLAQFIVEVRKYRLLCFPNIRINRKSINGSEYTQSAEASHIIVPMLSFVTIITCLLSFGSQVVQTGVDHHPLLLDQSRNLHIFGKPQSIMANDGGHKAVAYFVNWYASLATLKDTTLTSSKGHIWQRP